MNGEGSYSFSRKENRWKWKVVLSDGSVKQFSGNTKAIVQSKINDWKEKGMLEKEISFSTLIDEWTEEYRRTGEGKQRTLDGYLIVMDKYIRNSNLGRMRVADLTKAGAKKWRNNLQSKGYTNNSINKAIDELRKLLEFGIGNDYVTMNVANYTKYLKHTPKEKVIFSNAQMEAFCESAKEDNYYALFMLLLKTGAREGEIIALNINDYKNGILDITKTWDREYGMSDSTKNGDVRTIKLSDELKEIVESWLIQKNINSNENIASSHLMFPNAIGSYIDRGNLLRRNVKKILKNAGLPIETTIHNLRHTFISHQIKKVDNPIDVSHYVGQRNLATTINTYTHKTDDVQTLE